MFLSRTGFSESTSRARIEAKLFTLMEGNQLYNLWSYTDMSETKACISNGSEKRVTKETQQPEIRTGNYFSHELYSHITAEKWIW